MRTLKQLKELLPKDSNNLIISIREMFDLSIISYDEYIVLREFVLNKNL